MTARIGNIVIECPDPEVLADFYCRLLGMRKIRTDWMLIGREGETPRLAFDPVEDYHRPTWPDPAQPQQIHLDIGCADPAETEALVLDLGATRLPDLGECPSYADPAGHPFCLFGHEFGEDTDQTTEIVAVCVDCFSPRALAAFYAELLDMPVRKEDSQGWALIAKADDSGPMLAFQGAHIMPPNWPDPAYPQQMHLDFGIDERATLETAERLGALRLPDMGGSCAVYADPSGHPFCLCLPGE